MAIRAGNTELSYIYISGDADKYARKLILSSCFNDYQRQIIEDNLNQCETEDDYFSIIETLLQNQLNPITHGFNYKQRDIQNHLNKVLIKNN
jgi:hypothetical protein